MQNLEGACFLNTLQVSTGDAMRSFQVAHAKYICDECEVELASGGPADPVVATPDPIPDAITAFMASGKRTTPVSYKSGDMFKRRRRVPSGHALLCDHLRKKLDTIEIKLREACDEEERKCLIACARSLGQHLREVKRGMCQSEKFLQLKTH